MATLTIEGRKVNVDDSFFQLTPEQQEATVEEISQAYGITPGSGALPEATAGTPVGVQTRPGMGISPEDMQSGMNEMSQMTMGAAPNQNANPENTDDYIRAKMEATKMIGPRGQDGGMGQSAGDFIDRAMMDSIPFTDEIYSATIGNVGRMMRDGVGLVDAYKREQLLQNELSDRRYERSPIASTGGMLAGSLATGGAVLKSGGLIAKGVTKTGRFIPGMTKLGNELSKVNLGNTARLATFGGVTGLGQGEGTDRFKNAAIGAVTAPVVGAVLNKGGQMVSKAIAPKAAKALPASQMLKQQGGDLLEAAKASGAALRPAAVDNLIGNMKLAAGRLDPELHKDTIGVFRYLDGFRKKPMDMESFLNARIVINRQLETAKGNDGYALKEAKKALDAFADRVDVKDVIGGRVGLDMIKQGNSLYARGSRTKEIEQLSELARLKTGNFTQAGEARAISQQAQTLARDIIKNGSQGYTKAEIELLDKIATGETSGKLARAVSKYAPRGVVSIGGTMGGAGLATALGGPVLGGLTAAAIPAAGFLTAKSVDKAALAAILQLEEMVASGKASPALKKIAPKMLGFTPGLSMGTAKLIPQAIEQRR